MKKIILSSTLMSAILLILGTLFISSGKAWSDDDGEIWRLFDRKPTVLPVVHNTYKDECSSCHMAYSPGLLPSESWKKIMLNLENHFGDNAELNAETQKEILNYLLENSAENTDYRSSQKIIRSLTENKVVDRITMTPYFIRKHDEIPKRFITENPKVASFSQCNSCHKNAEKGHFDEDDVNIPGIGSWED